MLLCRDGMERVDHSHRHDAGGAGWSVEERKLSSGLQVGTRWRDALAGFVLTESKLEQLAGFDWVQALGPSRKYFAFVTGLFRGHVRVLSSLSS
ncbi:hypothetical protein llap_10581 [Limosa lapponica baueri]|uniref:Uncharacterized protein n=1 Tax=Limosa lapponica baueri TaxID=1758121 RepID=A0A2I0TZ87_LIMLA|nr:hypothetical protein llap_10581 [Limosa lapponica baueri]